MSVRFTSLVCILLLGGGLLAASPAAAEGSIANVVFEAQIPAPTLELAASANGRHVLVMDEEARFTFIPELGDDEQVWVAPKAGVLSALGPGMGEVDPVPQGVAVTPDGDHWGATVSYSGEFGGKLWSFARWSDQPVWSYDLTDGAREADQPRVLSAGGGYLVLGTEKGYVYVFKAEGDGSTQGQPYRTYKQDNHGNRFGAIADVDVSRDGKRFLIGTAASEKGSAHLYSDVFFMYTFKRITGTVQDTAISADGTRGAVAVGQGATTRLHYLDLTTGRTIWETSIGSDLGGMALSADGQTLVLGTDDGRTLVFQERGLPNDRDPVTEHEFVDAIDAVAVSDDGRSIAAGTAGGKLHFLAPHRGVPLWTHDAGSALVGTALAADAELLVLSARTQENGRVIFTAAEHAIEQVAPPQPRLAPGVINTVAIEIGNNGNRMEEVRLTWGTLPEGWEGLAANVSVAPGETATLSAKVSVAKGQLPGTFPLPVMLQTATKSIPLALTAVVPEVTSGHLVESWALPAAVPGGAPAAYMFSVENTGNTLNIVTLGYAKLPNGWKAAFVGPTEFRLKPGEDRQVALKVWAPPGMPVGREAWFDVVAAWTHGEERVPLSVRVVDGPSYKELLSAEEAKDGDDLLHADLKEASLKEPVRPSESEDSPGVGVVALLAAVVGLAFLARRRRAL